MVNRDFKKVLAKNTSDRTLNKQIERLRRKHIRDTCIIIHYTFTLYNFMHGFYASLLVMQHLKLKKNHKCISLLR